MQPLDSCESTEICINTSFAITNTPYHVRTEDL